MTELTCAHCGKPFDSKRASGKFCSGKCRVAAYRAGAEPLSVTDPEPLSVTPAPLSVTNRVSVTPKPLRHDGRDEPELPGMPGRPPKPTKGITMSQTPDGSVFLSDSTTAIRSPTDDATMTAEIEALAEKWAPRPRGPKADCLTAYASLRRGEMQWGPRAIETNAISCFLAKHPHADLSLAEWLHEFHENRADCMAGRILRAEYFT